MKRKILLSTLLLSMFLSSCASIKGKFNPEKNLGFDGWTTKLIDQNLLDTKSNQYKNVKYTYDSVSFSSSEIYSSQYEEYGLLLII